MSRLHTQQSGKGPVLIVLHGLFGNLDNFRSVALHMDRSYSVIRMDLPGHGRSPSLESLSIESMATSVLDELSAMGIKNYYLIGHSLGGKVAMSMAGNPRSEGLEKLCIVDIAPKVYAPHHQPIFDALLNLDLETLQDRRNADQLLREGIPDAGVRAFILKSLYKHESGRFRWRFDLPQLAKDYPLICKAPVINSTIKIPVLFIKGSESDYLTSHDGDLIKSVCTQPQLKIISGAGHWPHAEKPGQFTRLCMEFLSA